LMEAPASPLNPRIQGLGTDPLILVVREELELLTPAL
jgi:hypothetical protein